MKRLGPDTCLLSLLLQRQIILPLLENSVILPSHTLPFYSLIFPCWLTFALWGERELGRGQREEMEQSRLFLPNHSCVIREVLWHVVSVVQRIIPKGLGDHTHMALTLAFLCFIVRNVPYHPLLVTGGASVGSVLVKALLKKMITPLSFLHLQSSPP